MGYQLPTFNLECNIWHEWDMSTAPPAIAANVANVPCNLQFAKKIHGNAYGRMYLLVPKGTDIRDNIGVTSVITDVVEVPAGSKRWYAVAYVDDVSKGFPTEHRCAEIDKAQTTAQAAVFTDWLWPTPYP